MISLKWFKVNIRTFIFYRLHKDEIQKFDNWGRICHPIYIVKIIGIFSLCKFRKLCIIFKFRK